MSLLVLFGLPATGKTFVGTILKNHFGYHFHDGDVHIPEDMNLALQTNSPVTEDMRNRFMEALLNETKKRSSMYEHLVIAQTFIKDRHRKLLAEEFPAAKFLLIETPDRIREQRLQNRFEYPLDLEYSRNMVKNFDVPTIPFHALQNDGDGGEEIKTQLSALLKTASS